MRHRQVIFYKTSMRHLQITSMHLQDRLIRRLSEVFCKTSTICLAKVSSRCLTKISFRFAFKTSFGHLQNVLLVLVRHLVDVFLPTISDDLKSFLVYKLTCATCSSSYIGETCHYFKTRIEEHIKMDNKSYIATGLEPRTT